MKKIVLMCLLVVSLFGDETCKLLDKKNGKIYKVCGEQKSLILEENNHYYYSLSTDSSDEEMATMYRNDKATDLKSEEWFIFDYKNIVVYDNKCLGGNFAYISDEDKKLYYNKYGSSDDLLFNKQNFEHCKQPLDKWLKKPYKPY